jgi:hypothetical protein
MHRNSCGLHFGEAWFGSRIFRLLLLAIGGLSGPTVHGNGRFLDVIWPFNSFLLIAAATACDVWWRRDYVASLQRLSRSKRRREAI